MLPVQIFICNPATKSWLPIPYPKQIKRYPYADDVIMLLAYYHGPDDYMVLNFQRPYPPSSLYYTCEYYKPNEGSWKKMERRFFTGGREIKFNMLVYDNGIIHLMSNQFPVRQRNSHLYAPCIVSCNLENDTTTTLKLPRGAKKSRIDFFFSEVGIFKWGKVSSSAESSICFVRLRKSVFTIWALTDYESSRWKRILKIRIKGMGLREKDPVVTGFAVVNGDLLIFSTERGLYSYGLTEENYMVLEKICEHRCGSSIVCFTPYKDTLHPCGPEGASLLC
ncbi:uncharacterized protein LOC113851321 [Abrus precatorius]|uniref:Uncharacterized protein LOC113851321 n=1 Tax=Abrus precatorius TaxID=3816 RepID=A0A8B8K1Q9_ABRPR|nr:uncharacterized protein LOC113851321 [Abrus precatorius]